MDTRTWYCQWDGCGRSVQVSVTVRTDSGLPEHCPSCGLRAKWARDRAVDLTPGGHVARHAAGMTEQDRWILGGKGIKWETDEKDDA